MMKLLIPTLIMTSILHKSRSWLLLPMVILTMTLLSFFMYPTFHSSSPSFTFYLDSLSAPLITLTLWISSLMILVSQKLYLTLHSPKKFLMMTSLLLLFLILTFSMNNLIMFYIFFEASLIPTFILILGWGYQPERLQASMYLLLYTITASLPLLLMILLLTYSNNTIFITTHTKPLTTSPLISTIWWLFMLLAFMVKMPMYSVHLWLPKAHVEAPVAGSMILASILLKLGSYAMIRVSSMFPMMNQLINFMFMTIAMIGAVFTSTICLRQTDLKALIAYSSVGHMGLLMAGTLTNQQWGWQGSLVGMISHGLVSSALFVTANSVYETTQTRSLFLTKGLLSMSPPMSLIFFILSASNMAAPPTINLLGEISLIPPTLASSTLMIIPIALLTFLGAAYSLHLYTATNHGHPPTFSNPHFLFNPRNFTALFLHAIPATILILKMDTMNPWI